MNNETLQAGVTVYIDNGSLVKLFVTGLLLFVAFFAVQRAMGK